MSGRLQGLIYELKFGGLVPKAIAAKLADWANDDGTGIFASKTTMHEQLECSKRTIDKHINLWLLLGILRIDDLGGGRLSKTKRQARMRKYKARGKSTIYSFNMPALQRLQDEIDSIEELTAAAEARGELDEDGCVRREVIEQIRAGHYQFAKCEADTTQDASMDDSTNNSAAAAPLTKGAAAAPLTPKGCSPGSLRVQPRQSKGAAAAPEPYRTRRNPNNGRARDGDQMAAARPPGRVKQKGPSAILRWHLEDVLGRHVVGAWFGEVRVVIPPKPDDPAEIVCGSPFRRQYVEQNFERVVCEAVREAFDRGVTFVVKSKHPPEMQGDVLFSMQSQEGPQHEARSVQ
ncbi:MAG: hypothetical protein GDA50_04130 [Alphaproteobacteria bacterium GM202ARS2]|nr:hypothetical protein [Alphaproteobacteria bacterium GM202ARS2]